MQTFLFVTNDRRMTDEGDRTMQEKAMVYDRIVNGDTNIKRDIFYGLRMILNGLLKPAILMENQVKWKWTADSRKLNKDSTSKKDHFSPPIQGGDFSNWVNRHWDIREMQQEQFYVPSRIITEGREEPVNPLNYIPCVGPKMTSTQDLNKDKSCPQDHKSRLS